MADNSKFPLEKILTISARDYCEMHGGRLDQYEARGIREVCYFDSGVFSRDKIPNNTEVVVGYRVTIGGTGEDTPRIISIGTALIRKKE